MCMYSAKLVQPAHVGPNEKIKDLGDILWCDKQHASKKPLEVCENFCKRKANPFG